MYKKKYRYSGQLYENHYYSDMIHIAQGLLEVCCYIHQKPMRTKIPLVSELEHYPYSSFQYYVTPDQAPVYLNPLQLFQHFQLKTERTLAHYVTYYRILNNESDTTLMECCVGLVGLL